jgi:hypothetical protein
MTQQTDDIKFYKDPQYDYGWITINTWNHDFSDVITKETAERLIKELEDIFQIKSHEFARGFAQGKRSVQFPICACEFADDEETLISPCQAHKAWAKIYSGDNT